jgi:two-component SAPR family response regulator
MHHIIYNIPKKLNKRYFLYILISENKHYTITMSQIMLPLNVK